MPKRIRIKSDSKIHFVTFTVSKHIPVFNNTICADELLSIFEFYKTKNRIRVYGYVIMPTHVHILLDVLTNESISAVIRDIKKYYSYRFKNALIDNTNLDVDKFMIADSFRFWQEGFDEVTIISETVFYTKLKYLHDNPVKAGMVENAIDYPYSSAKYWLSN